MKIKIKDAVPMVFSIILAVGVMTVFKACAPMEDGTYMHCHEAQIGVFAMALLLLALSIVSVFVKNAAAAKTVKVLQVLLAAATVLIPGVINKMCMMNTMRCHALMKPFTIVVSIGYAVSVIVPVVLEGRLDKKEGQTA